MITSYAEQREDYQGFGPDSWNQFTGLEAPSTRDYPDYNQRKKNKNKNLQPSLQDIRLALFFVFNLKYFSALPMLIRALPCHKKINKSTKNSFCAPSCLRTYTVLTMGNFQINPPSGKNIHPFLRASVDDFSVNLLFFFSSLFLIPTEIRLHKLRLNWHYKQQLLYLRNLWHKCKCKGPASITKFLFIYLFTEFSFYV